ncbi:MAG TPA: hypothetical protein VJ063_12635, partial [Verrucomicrobiae bacterium]|nr:hypothetical protein [Verrucomicrobiae bacterium]
MIKRIVVGGLSLVAMFSVFNYAAENSGSANEKLPDVTALRAEMERLKGLVPDQSHAMSDVGDHFANLWFA